MFLDNIIPAHRIIPNGIAKVEKENVYIIYEKMYPYNEIWFEYPFFLFSFSLYKWHFSYTVGCPELLFLNSKLDIIVNRKSTFVISLWDQNVSLCNVS